MTRPAIRTVCYAFGLTALLTAVGCGVQTPVVAFSDDGDFLPQDVGEGLVASPNPLIPDVPMPVGFRAVPSQSNWRFDGQVRVVNHVYQGHAKQGDAAEFYQRTLPDYNWTMTDMQSVGDATVLRYVKGPEQLAITTRHGWGVSTIAIKIEGR